MQIEYATPKEAWTGKRVDLGRLRVFGCKTFVRISGQKRTKLDEKMKVCLHEIL
jgi:hypothetical protein